MLRLGRWLNTLVRIGKGKEQGQVMIMALIVLTLGGLVITPTLNHMATGAKSTVIHKRLTGELYAADAGVEYAMWRIKSGIETPFSTSISVGGTSVNITVTRVTSANIPDVPILSEDLTQSDRIKISHTLVDLGGGVFSYTINIQNVMGSTIHLCQIGAGLPDHFTYVNGSSSGVTLQDPKIIGRKLTWPFSDFFSSNYKPATLRAGESTTQTFRMSGNGTPQGYYSWVVATPDSIGIISTCMGYNVVSQAGGTTIEANVVQNQGVVYPISWKIR